MLLRILLLYFAVPRLHALPRPLPFSSTFLGCHSFPFHLYRLPAADGARQLAVPPRPCCHTACHTVLFYQLLPACRCARANAPPLHPPHSARCTPPRACGDCSWPRTLPRTAAATLPCLHPSPSYSGGRAPRACTWATRLRWEGSVDRTVFLNLGVSGLAAALVCLRCRYCTPACWAA